MKPFRLLPLLPIVAWATPGAASPPPPPFVHTTAAVYSAVLDPETHTLGPAVFDCTQEDIEPAGAVSLASSSCGTGFSTGVTGAGSSSATAAAGTLRVGSSAQTSDGLGAGDANGSAEFADPVSASVAGTLHAEMSAQGTLDFEDSSSAYAFYNLDFYTADFTTVLDDCGSTFEMPGADGSSCAVDTPVDAGQVVVLYGRLTAASSVSMAGNASSSASADFADTAEVIRVELLDDHGQPIRDAVMQFGSGATYPVPEPAGALPLAAALGTLATARTRRR